MSETFDSERTSAAISASGGRHRPGSRCLAVIAETASVLPSRGSQDGYGLDATECYLYSYGFLLRVANDLSNCGLCE
jgi:hypothetical protein